MENAELENSIRAEAARMIAEIREKEALEIRRLEDAYKAEMDSFEKQIKAETDARISQELSRMENRASLEQRKIVLKSVERFISRIVNDVVKGIRDNPLYRIFMIDAVSGILKKIPDGAEIRLKKEDLLLEEEIFAAIGAVGKNSSVVIVEDPGIKWGGCLVFDKAQGRVFNNTLERIYFRKSLLIRQNVMKILADASQEKSQETSKEGQTVKP